MTHAYSMGGVLSAAEVKRRLEVYRDCAGNVSEFARRIGIGRGTARDFVSRYATTAPAWRWRSNARSRPKPT